MRDICCDLCLIADFFQTCKFFVLFCHAKRFCSKFPFVFSCLQIFWTWGANIFGVAQQVAPIFFSPNNIPGLTVWAEGQPGVPPSFSTCSHRPRLLPLRPVPVRRPVKGQNGHKGDHQHPEGLAAGTPEEPLPHQRREDHACYHYENDTHTGGQRDMFSELNLYKMFQFSGLSGTLQAQFGGHQPPGPLKINP